MKKYFFFSIFSLFLLSSFLPLHAFASDGTLDASFNIGTGFASNNTVNILARQPDGKIIVGGSFTSYNGTATNRVVRLNVDGSVDGTFNVGSGISGGATPGVSSLLLQPDGKILVGGSFDTYGSASSIMLVRLNADGSQDGTFTSLFSGISNVLAFARQSDGKIIVAGNFSAYGGTSANRIVRINADGSRDTSFVMGSGFNLTSIDALALQSDGKIIVGGNFNMYNGTAVRNIVRLNADGSIDGSFNPGGAGFIGSPLNGIVRALALDDESRVIAGGDFTSYNGTLVNKIIRLNTDGSIDGTFTPSGTGFDNNGVRAMAIDDDGKILLGGNFTSFNGTTTNRIIRLNEDGSRDGTFDSGSGFDTTVSVLSIDPDDNVLAGGLFTSYNGTTTNAIVRLGFSAPAITFSAASSTIAYDTAADLSWDVTGYVDSCTASGDWSGSKAASGTTTIADLIEDSTFTLACVGPGGTTTVAVPVTVSAAPVPVISFSADNTSVSSNSTTELTWSVANLYGGICTASDAWSGDKTATGTEATLGITGDTTFTLSCTGPGGTTQNSVTISVQVQNSGGGGGGGGIIWNPAPVVPPPAITPVIQPGVPVASQFIRNLALGATGSDVRALQQFLNTQGFVLAQSGPGAPGSETTTFGYATQYELTQFQKTKGITPDSGYFGDATRMYIASSTPATATPAPYIFTRYLRTGTTDSDVLQLQQYLNTHGFTLASIGPGSPGNETSYFGLATKKALTALQDAHTAQILAPNGLTQGTGYFGPSTMGYVNASGN